MFSCKNYIELIDYENNKNELYNKREECANVRLVGPFALECELDTLTKHIQAFPVVTHFIGAPIFLAL